MVLSEQVQGHPEIQDSQLLIYTYKPNPSHQSNHMTPILQEKFGLKPASSTSRSTPSHVYHQKEEGIVQKKPSLNAVDQSQCWRTVETSGLHIGLWISITKYITDIPRVPKWRSPRPNWDPYPLSRKSVCPLLQNQRGRHTRLWLRGGGPDSYDWRKSLGLCLLCDRDQWFWQYFIISMCGIKFWKDYENLRPVYKRLKSSEPLLTKIHQILPTSSADELYGHKPQSFSPNRAPEMWESQQLLFGGRLVSRIFEESNIPQSKPK